VSTPAPQTTSPATTFADRFWALAPGPENIDIPEPLHTIVIVRHFLAVLDELQTGPRKLFPGLGAMLRTAEVDGCVSYASPEQLNGEPLDTRSVVFSLGVVLFERLAGRHPFGAENNRPRRITRIQRGEMGSGVNSFPTIAGSVRSVLVRAMNPFPEAER
jgi:serine/threonine protein kinase